MKPENRIHNAITQFAQRDGQTFPMVVIGLDVGDPDSLDSFMSNVAETFKNQRMCSPPETTGLFVTLIGELTAANFKDRWIKISEGDPILKFFMDQMTDATVLHGKPDGTVIAHISLK